jgi:hypothetical protein
MKWFDFDYSAEVSRSFAAPGTITGASGAKPLVLAPHIEGSVPDAVFASLAECHIDGWDGEDARPVLQATIDVAKQVGNAIGQVFGTPWVSPGVDGSIGLIWDDDYGRIHAVAHADGAMQVFARFEDDESGPEAVFPAGTAPIETLYFVLSHWQKKHAADDASSPSGYNRATDSASSAGQYFPLAA